MADKKDRRKEIEEAESNMVKMLKEATDEEIEMLRDAYPSNIYVKNEWMRRQKKKKEGMTYENSPSPPPKQ